MWPEGRGQRRVWSERGEARGGAWPAEGVVGGGGRGQRKVWSEEGRGLRVPPTQPQHLLLISDPDSRQRESGPGRPGPSSILQASWQVPREGLDGPANPEKGARPPSQHFLTQVRLHPEKGWITANQNNCQELPPGPGKLPAPRPSSRKLFPGLLSFENHRHSFYKTCT